MNYTTIEKQVLAKADADTESEIRNAVTPIERLIENHHRQFQTEIRWQGSDHKVSLPFRGMVIHLIKEILKEEITDKRRKNAMGGFLSKFNAVVQKIEELGIELDGISSEGEEEL